MSRSIRIKGPASVSGIADVPGDKSISHRVAILASLANGPSQIRGFSSSVDCGTTLSCIENLGVRITRHPQELIIHGVGLRRYRPAREPVKLDAGNSGTTIRILSGVLAAQAFTSELDGDASLRRRPMGRIIEPLGLMGARIETREGKRAPLNISGGPLHAISYSSPVASAQVKSCVLFAGLHADGTTTVSEPAQSRNHSELMLREFGARIEFGEGGLVSRIAGGVEFLPLEYHVPGDLSSAAFLIAAVLITSGSHVLIRGVNLNPTRAAFLDVLNSIGAGIVRQNERIHHGELVGDLEVSSGRLQHVGRPTPVAGDIIPNLIDEIPILAVIGAHVEGGLEVRGAKELRIKESDRIRTIVDGMRALGADIEEFDDGFAVPGPQVLSGGNVDSAGDHRIAMAFTVAGLAASGATAISGAECAEVSFPEFYTMINTLTGGKAIS